VKERRHCRRVVPSHKPSAFPRQEGGVRTLATRLRLRRASPALVNPEPQRPSRHPRTSCPVESRYVGWTFLSVFPDVTDRNVRPTFWLKTCAGVFTETRSGLDGHPRAPRHAWLCDQKPGERDVGGNNPVLLASSCILPEGEGHRRNLLCPAFLSGQAVGQTDLNSQLVLAAQLQLAGPAASCRQAR
jgi:hypothetical protein